MISIAELEKRLFDKELVRVIFRAPACMLVPDYTYTYIVGDNNNFKILKQRLENTYPDVPFVVIDGYGITRHDLGRKMGDIRNSYLHNSK